MDQSRGVVHAVAHVRADGLIQSLEAHLLAVAYLASRFASKFDLAMQGELIGLVHDLGKYSGAFQQYIRSATGLLNQDEDEEFVDSAELKGKIDHSTSGAQWIWRALADKGSVASVTAQFLALCVASHHSGMIDCLGMSSGEEAQDRFSRRMQKSTERTYLDEVVGKADPELLLNARALLAAPEITQSFQRWVARVLSRAPDKNPSSPVVHQQLGLLARALFSCLIDADRIDTADFEHRGFARRRLHGNYASWETLIERLEEHLTGLAPRRPIDILRQEISASCLDAAMRPGGIYTLTVPTGGGKTLASLRFALHHAREHQLDRIIFVIPFTSIIDQNAAVVRRILEPAGVEAGSVLLEHHSNLTPETQTWRGKILSENWDAPVVYTTSVQLLEALFGAGTRGARRMHQLARAVLVFDEIQSLPVNCVHLFNNAMNFLADFCGSTIVLSTATQPLLDRVEPKNGAIRISPSGDLVPDVRRYFDELKRVEVRNARKPGGWSQAEIAELAQERAAVVGTCLVVVNTKRAAQAIYRLLCDRAGATVFHLSTNMCPAHRKSVLDEVRRRLGAQPPLPTLCVSTQLIEAGVDVDFGSVIRYSAGLDSIAQAAGRCNRNGLLERGVVFIVNPREEDENLKWLPDIRIGRDCAERVLDDFSADPARFGDDCIGPQTMDWYYQNYFFARMAEMSYPLKRDVLGRDDTLLNLLAANSHALDDYRRTRRQSPPIYLRQSFMAAARAFKAIDAATRGIVVPYQEVGTELINDLCAAHMPEQAFELLRRAQQYSVNVLPNLLEKLRSENAVVEIRAETGIFYLADSRYYTSEFGLAETPEGLMEVLSA